jgi:hypothetical protein
MTVAGAQTCGAGCTAAAIGSFCTLSQKSPKKQPFSEALDFYYRLCIMNIAAIDNRAAAG